MAGVGFDHVRKTYGRVEALRGLDLEVADGELMVLVGPSGSGKTTALRVAAGLEALTDGRVRIGERDVTRVPPADRNVSMIFQGLALFPHMSVEENIGYGLAIRRRRAPRSVRRERVLQAAEATGCDHLLDRRPSQLSGGERQRVALARALVRHPDVFLLDEPLSSLDAQVRVSMRGELERFHREVGATMIHVTHDQVEALTLGERVAVLDRGALQQVGTPDEIYKRPVNRFVATFIGSPAMNLLPAVIEEGQLRAGPFSLSLPPAMARLSGRTLELGIRPEDLDVSLTATGAPARVDAVEVAGPESFLRCTVAGGLALVARVGPEVRPSPGGIVHLDFERERAYLFDVETGRTLVHAD